MNALSGKVVLVSGGTTGVGAAVARGCARPGAVAVTGRRPGPGERAAAELRELGAAASCITCDIADVAADRAAVAAVVTEYGRIDCLVNAAGYTVRGTIDARRPSCSTCTSP
jgi:NAD(P)-dependent dehydrogenase (short-subunit alcohol dehydrogenase family)